MRLSPAFARLLVSGAPVLLAIGLAAPLAAQPAHRAPRREATIDEIAPPRREGFDQIVVQLPPLAPVRRGAPGAAVAAPAVAAGPAAAPESEPVIGAVSEQSAAAAVTPQPAPAPEKPPEAQMRETLAADAHPEPPLERVEEPAPAPMAEAPLPSAADPLPPTEEPLASAESAPGAEAAPAAEPSADTPNPPRAEASEAASPADPAIEAAPAPAAELPPPVAIPAEEEQDSGSWTDWALIAAVLAILGLTAARRLKARRAPALASAPAPASVAAPSPPRPGRLAPLLAVLRARGGAVALALLARLRNLRRRKGDSDRETQTAAEWAQISATLRARAAPASTPQAEDIPAGASESPAPKADARRWDQDKEDGIELLEPGSPGARALVMSARRKLQAAGQS
ncbi:hypothetical protein [Methylosinus sp. Sm6]|uniref:hypothetical protein n=1 Tax=Methylosinus sp. Sm6 TaxID=2866948 RepID=UPI001C994657|nr:hypothetical protein [Methylosinus sp. Sm6]MBY6241132.1 hypothetical protein [Methylosinus sp. Sm6]